MQCTWKNCNENSVTEEKDRYGNVWAKLCQTHKDELENALNSLDPKTMLRCWVLASGGAKKMTSGEKNNDN